VITSGGSGAAVFVVFWALAIRVVINKIAGINVKVFIVLIRLFFNSPLKGRR
jgi:hypothetical protein